MNFDETISKDSHLMNNQNICTGYSHRWNKPTEFSTKIRRGLGGLALANMLHADSGSPLHHQAKAKRVIYLFQSGGPSQIDLLITKRLMKKLAKNSRIPSARDSA